MADWTCKFQDDDVLDELLMQLATFDYFSRQSHSSDRIEFLVGNTESPSLKIEVFANEHPPPHFRVKYAGETANYQISDCEQINGDLKRYYRVIRRWHSKNKSKLIEAWNEFRPSGCPVGKYVDS